MKIQITPDKNYCSFGDGVVYEFVPDDCIHYLNDCYSCAFWPSFRHSDKRIKCLSVPCQKGIRRDKKGGFWRISEAVDYQAFVKMLENGG